MFRLFIIQEELSGERKRKNEVGAMRQEEGTGQTGWVGGPAGGAGCRACAQGWWDGSVPWVGARELGLDRFTMRTGGEGRQGRRSPVTPW